MGGIFKNDEEVGFAFATALPLVDSILVLELVVVCCLSLPLPVNTARALSKDVRATSKEVRGVLDRSTVLEKADVEVDGGIDIDDSPPLAVSTCREERLFDFESLASFLARAFASFSDFLRRSSSSSIERRIASMTISSSRLQKREIQRR